MLLEFSGEITPEKMKGWSQSNGILLSYKKECIRANPNEVDELRAYYTE